MKRRLTLALLGAGLCLVAVGAVEKQPVLIYNPSPSASIGWYKVIHSNDYKIGDLVAANIPEWAAQLAHSRGYLPKDVPVIKTIIAAPGSQFCIRGGSLIVADVVPFDSYSTDSLRRELPVQPEGCRSLEAGEFLLASVNYDQSFDSRYFGSVGHSDLIGQVKFIGEVE